MNATDRLFDSRCNAAYGTRDRETDLRCCCGAEFTHAQWDALKTVFVGEREDGSPVDCKNCPACRSTKAIDSLEALS